MKAWAKPPTGRPRTHSTWSSRTRSSSTGPASTRCASPPITRRTSPTVPPCQADIGVKDGVIAGIGKAGNPDVMAGVHPALVIGSATEVIAGEKLIVTAGAIDAHCHYICPQQVTEALASGTTTMIGGGTGPSAGTNATTCTSSPFYMRQMLAAMDGLPMNFALTGKGNDTGTNALEDIVKAGAAGLKLHEDWGSTPSAIVSALDVGDKYDVQVCPGFSAPASRH